MSSQDAATAAVSQETKQTTSKAVAVAVASNNKKQPKNNNNKASEEQQQQIPLNIVILHQGNLSTNNNNTEENTSQKNVAAASADSSSSSTSGTNIIVTVALPLQRGQSELQLEAFSTQGGITAFRGLPIVALKQYIYVVVRPTELTFQNLENLFPAKKEEFMICAMYAAPFVDAGVQLGCLPMTIRMSNNLPEFLALKLHKNRCIVRLSPSIGTPHGIRKKSKKFALVVDGGLWETCIDAITVQQERVHGHSWLNEYLTKTFYSMNCEPSKYKTNLHCISVVHANSVSSLVEARKVVVEAAKELENEETTAAASASSENNKSSSSSSSSSKITVLQEKYEQAQKLFKQVAKSAFAAGEIGCSCGTIYTSLTGAHSVSGAGSIQLGVLGALLVQAGYTIWDLGMKMDYKEEGLGGVEVSRNRWIQMVKEKTAQNPGRKLADLDGYVVKCSELLGAALAKHSTTSTENEGEEEETNSASSAKTKATAED